MNEELEYYDPNGSPLEDPWGMAWMCRRAVKTMADFRNPGPAQCFVFLDEREDSLMDSHFFLHPDGFLADNPALYRLVSYPGNYHNGAACFSFADGWIRAPGKGYARAITLSIPRTVSCLRAMRTLVGCRSGRSRGTIERPLIFPSF
jgi:hypothetical protein